MMTKTDYKTNYVKNMLIIHKISTCIFHMRIYFTDK